MSVLEDSKLFLGIMMIVLNIGSRHLVDEFSDSEEEYSRNIVLRRIAIFAVCFVGTRDLVVSLLLTGAFILIASGVSKRSREGMTTVKNSGMSKADNPAYDTKIPTLF
jgi:hypothetical protein